MNRFLLLLIACFIVVGCQSKTVVIKTQPETPKYKIKHVSSDKHLIQGKKFFNNGKYKLAARNFMRAIATDSHNWEAHYYLGLTLQKQGRYDQAIGSFNTSLRHAPKNNKIRARVNYSLGVSWEHERYFGRATELYVKVLKLNPKHSGAKAGKARVMLKATKEKKKKKNPRAF